jgi:hypothetical protein
MDISRKDETTYRAPAFINSPVNIHGFCDLFFVMEIMKVEGERAERTHLGLQVWDKDSIHRIDHLGWGQLKYKHK